MLLVAFVLTGASASAQNSGYKPGERMTTFIQGEKMFIYNTSLPSSQDRTGFYRYNSASSTVQLVKQKPFASSDKYRYDVNGTSIWTIASVENVGTNDAPVYKMSIKNSADQYLTFNMGYSNEEQFVYVRSWENTASDKRESVKSEAADGSVIENANITDSHKVWTVSQAQNGSSNYWNGEPSSVTIWDKGHPFAFYTTEAMTDQELTNVQSALATTKTNIVSGIETVLTDCGVSVKLTPITLTEGNTTSNAEHNAGKPAGYELDGGGIAALFDKTDSGEPNLGTYFHSRWAGTEVNAAHYIQVDAGEALSAFVFGYSTRNSANQDPTAFDILGSTDGEEWHKIASIDKETFALKTGASATYAQRGFVLPSGTTYRHFRFAVTANATGRTHGGYPYFALSDFNFSKVTFSCNESYKQNASVLLNNYLLKQEVDALLAGVTDPESAVLTTARNMVANQFFADASKQLPALLPFNLTTDTSKQNYYIKSGRGNYYFSLKPWDEGKIHLDNTTSAAENAYRYWYFTRSEMSGAIYIHPVTNPTALIGYTDTSDGANRLNNTAANRNNKFCYAIATYQNKQVHCLRPFNTQTYISNHGGETNDMGFWTGVDGGTTVTFEEAGALPDNIVDLSAKYMTYTCPAASLIGNDLNQYNQSQFDTYSQAESKLKNEANTLTETFIRDFFNGPNFTTLAMNQPVPNGFYRFRNVGSNKYLTTTTKNSRMTMAADATSAAIFYLTSDNKLVGYDNGFYTKNFTNGNYDFQGASGTGNVVTFPNGNTYTEATACYRINCGDRSLYGNRNYTENDVTYTEIDGAGTQAASNTDTGYDWTIEAVTALPLTISNVGWSTFYAPVPVTIPDGVTAYIAGIEGNICTLTEVTGTVPANTGLILYKQDGGNVEMTIAESGTTDVTGNALMGGTNTVNRENGYIYYALQKNSSDASKVGLYQYTTGTLKGFRAFYRAASESPEANAAGFSFDTIITGIDGILGTDGTNDGKIYDLSGRRLNKPVKGLNIIGGKKVLVK